MAFAFSVTPTSGTGTISIAKNGTAVTGVGTNFTSPSLVGQIILVNGFNSVVTAVASATTMTIVSSPVYEITGEAFSFCAGSTNINQTGADTDPSGLSALIGVRTSRVGIQTIYDLGCMRLATTGAAAVFSYDANLHCIVWSNQITQPEFTNGAGRTVTITGTRTDGTYSAPFYPRCMATPRTNPISDSYYQPTRRSVVNSGTLNLTGVWFDGNQVQEMGGTANLTNVKWSSTDIAANYRMNSSGITVNGMELYNMPLTVISAPAAFNGMKFYNSGYTPVALPAVAPGSPRIYTDWEFLGASPLMNNFGGNANYVEFVNFGNWADFKLATNSVVSMAARFTKAVTVSVLDVARAPITGAIVYRLDTNNGDRGGYYTTDEHFIQTTVSGAASGKILAQVGRLPTGAATNSTPYTATMDYRNAANNGTGEDVLRYVNYEHLLASRSINTKGLNTLTSEQTLFADANITLNKAGAAAKLASSFTVDPVTKVVTVTANSTYDDVYDAIKSYKATANNVNLATPTLDSLIVTPNGSVLTAYTGWTMVVNTGVTLSTGVKFTTLVFTTVTLNGTGIIAGTLASGANITGNVTQATPTNFTGVTITGNLTYNTNTPITVTFTNSTVTGTVSNTGTGLVTIRRSNSTVGTAGANVTTQLVTALNLTGLTAGSQIYVSNGAGTQVDYVASSSTSYTLDTTGGTGTWAVKVRKYGQQEQIYTFIPANSSTTQAASYIPDTFVVASLATASAYTNLDTFQKVYDYSSYFNTTLAAMPFIPLFNKGFGTLTANFPYVLDPAAGSVMGISSGVVTTASSGFAESGTLLVTGSFTQGTATLSNDVQIRATNYDSELLFTGIDNIIIYATQADAFTNTSPGASSTSGVIRYLYGASLSGVVMSGTVYVRTTIGGVTEVQALTLTQGTTTLSLSTIVLLQKALTDLNDIKGTGFVKDTHSLTNIKSKAALAAALSA